MLSNWIRSRVPVARARARLDQRTRHLVFRPQLFIRLAILRISAPPLVQFGKRAHCDTSPARRSATSISRRGVRRVFFTNARTTTIRRSFAATYSARAMPSRPLKRISPKRTGQVPDMRSGWSGSARPLQSTGRCARTARACRRAARRVPRPRWRSGSQRAKSRTASYGKFAMMPNCLSSKASLTGHVLIRARTAPASDIARSVAPIAQRASLRSPRSTERATAW